MDVDNNVSFIQFLISAFENVFPLFDWLFFPLNGLFIKEKSFFSQKISYGIFTSTFVSFMVT